MEEGKTAGGVHVVMVSWSGFGHLAPMLQLAQVLVSAGVHATIVYSARTHARLQSAGLQQLAEQANARGKAIYAEVIPDGLPTDLSIQPTFEEVLAGVPVMQDGLEEVIRRHDEGGRPFACLISGTFCPWTAPVAKKCGLERVELWSSPAIIYSVGVHHPRLVSEGYVPFEGKREDTWISCIPGIPPMRASDYPIEMMPSLSKDLDETRLKAICERIQWTYAHSRDAHTVLINSIYELESSTFDALRSHNISALPIGPLIIQPLMDSSTGSSTLMHQPRTTTYQEDQSCLQWLHGKEPASVLYVAFGSDSRFSKGDLLELASGLEECQHSFLWVIRPGSVLGGEHSPFHDLLPEGFLERTADRGLVVAWAPQTQVLAHPATGAFLSHCGWNSTMESLSLGVPIIAWPQRADQGMNKHMIEQEWKVGISIKKNEEGKVLMQAIGRAIRSLMQGQEGNLVRKKVVEIKELMYRAVGEGGSSNDNLKRFVQDLIILSTRRGC